MFRYFVFFGVVIAVLTVLWSTWRIDRRLFAGVCVALVIFGLVFGIGAWQGSQQALVSMDTESVAFELYEAKPLETGTRLTGTLINDNAEDIAIVEISVVQEVCEAVTDNPNCTDNAQRSFKIRRHLESQSQAIIKEIIRLPSPPLEAGKQYRWNFAIEKVQGYRGSNQSSGLLN